MQPKKFVIWDLGATKCAAAIVEYDPPHFFIQKQCQYFLRDFFSLLGLVSVIEEELNISFREAHALCIAGAGQYNGHELILDKSGAGYPFPMEFKRIAEFHGWAMTFIVHDYTPIVCRTFLESEKDIKVLHAGVPEVYGRRVALGVGTGLGMKDAVLLPHGVWVGTNEAGHIGLSSPPIANQIEYEQHLALLDFIHRHPQSGLLTTFETLLSGPGLALMHQFMTGSTKLLNPEQVAEEIKQQKNSPTLQLFARYLGLFIGVVQLAFMPEGGIWMNGGVLQKNLNLFEEPLVTHFYRGIELSPSYQLERQRFPLKLMLGHEHAFLGGAFFLAQKLERTCWG